MKIEVIKKSGMEREYIQTFTCILNPEDSESVCLEVDVFHNGDTTKNNRLDVDGWFTHMHIITNGMTVTKTSFYSPIFDSLVEACEEIDKCFLSTKFQGRK